MAKDYDPDDVRAKAFRDVRVRPLPRITHPLFRKFCDDVRGLISSHISTYLLLRRDCYHMTPEDDLLLYWRHAMKFMNHLEYLATSNDPPGDRSRPDPTAGGDPGVGP